MDFTYLNAYFLKNHYPLPNIDRLINGSPGYQTLSFMDAYLGYNQIKIDPFDVSKKAFMSGQLLF